MKRGVVVTLASYVDVEGHPRTAERGDEIDVHEESVAAFDAAQARAVGERVVDSLPEPEPEPEPEAEPVKAKPTRSRTAKADG